MAVTPTNLLGSILNLSNTNLGAGGTQTSQTGNFDSLLNLANQAVGTDNQTAQNVVNSLTNLAGQITGSDNQLAQTTSLNNLFNQAISGKMGLSSDEFIPFSDLLKSSMSDVANTESSVKAAQAAVATGDADDLHTLMIETSKADLAVETFVQIRNKALDAYNEIMKMTL